MGRGVTAVLLVTAMSGCSADKVVSSLLSEPVLPAPVLSLVSGGNQTGRLNGDLPEPVVVRLVREGVAVANATITFEIQYPASPGPNWTWTAVTGANGTASVVISVSPGPEGGAKTQLLGPFTITARYREGCTQYSTGNGCLDYRTKLALAIPGNTIP